MLWMAALAALVGRERVDLPDDVTFMIAEMLRASRARARA